MSLVHLFCCCYRVAGVEVVVSRDDVLVVFFKDTATTEIYTSGHTLSPHDALPICRKRPDLWLHTKNRHLSRGEIDALVDRCDVVLAPYQRFVGSSGVLLWAASRGRPLLAQDYGLVGRLTADHGLGLTVDTTDVTPLTAASSDDPTSDRQHIMTSTETVYC